MLPHWQMQFVHPCRRFQQFRENLHCHSIGSINSAFHYRSIHGRSNTRILLSSITTTIFRIFSDIMNRSTTITHSCKKRRPNPKVKPTLRPNSSSVFSFNWIFSCSQGYRQLNNHYFAKTRSLPI